MAALQQGALNHPRRLNDVLRPCEFRRDIVGDRSQPDHLYLQSAAGGLHRFQLFSASAALLRSRRISPGEASDFIESGSGAGEFFHQLLLVAAGGGYLRGTDALDWLGVNAIFWCVSQ